MSTRIPASIFTGFLGSGKTTIITNLLDDLAKSGEKVVYIKNEIGDLSTDALLLKMLGGQTMGVVELTNGCICCTLTGQLYHAVNELADRYHPDRFIIESAGNAKPHDLALAISAHPRLLRDGVICVIDVINFNGYERVDSVAQNQASFTDLLVFNKVEEVDHARLQAVVSYVREVNAVAAIIEAPKGHAPKEILCGISSQLVLEKEDDSHDEDRDGLETLALIPSAMSLEKYTENVNNLGSNVLRIKGVIDTPNGAMLVNTVCKRTTTKEVPKNTLFKLMFVGFGLETQREKLKQFEE